jgi:hypothetical protein
MNFPPVGRQFQLHASHLVVYSALRDLRTELKAEMDTRFGRLEARFDSMQRMTLAAYVTAALG